MKLTMVQKILLAIGYVGKGAYTIVAEKWNGHHLLAGQWNSQGGKLLFDASLKEDEIRCSLWRFRDDEDFEILEIPGLEELFRSFEEDEEEKVRTKRKPSDRRADSNNARTPRKPKAKGTGRKKLHQG